MPKMLNIPFGLLSEQVIDDTTIKTLRKDYFLPKYLTQYLKGKKYDYPGQILKDHELLARIDHLDLERLITQPYYELGKHALQREITREERQHDSDSGIDIRVFYYEGNSRRIALEIAGVELVSVEIDEEDRIDPTTLKFGGYWFWEWRRLPDSIKLTIFRVMFSTGQSGLDNLANNSSDISANFSERKIPLRNIAQLGLFFISSNVSRNFVENVAPDDDLPEREESPEDLYKPGEGIPPEKYPESNECTKSPDYPFSECCVAHDLCYVEDIYGCGECARLKCDLDFLACMLKRAAGNPVFTEMAYIYFIAVRAGGGVSGFDYCASSPSGTGGFSLGSFANVFLIVGAGTAVGMTVGGLVASPVNVAVGIGAGLLTVGAAGAVMGRVFCETCEQMVDWIEHCEADRLVREERCRRQRKKCRKKKKWWKKIWCRIKYIWNCVIVDVLKKGACWFLKKVVYPITC